MSAAEVEREVARLTESAKHLLLTGEDNSMFGMAGVALILRGVMDYRRKWWLFGPKVLLPTRFGRKVRAALQETRDHD